MSSFNFRLVCLALSLVLAALVAGCGGGGDSGDTPTASQQVVRLTLEGPAGYVGGVSFDLVLAPGFVLDANGDEPLPGVVQAEVASSYLDSAYVAASGMLKLVILSNAYGFSPQPIATVSGTNLLVGAFPSAAAFSVFNLKVVDLRGQELSGYAVSVSVVSQ